MTSAPSKDIESASEVAILIDSFYSTVKDDALLAPVFSEQARVHWETHLPKMRAFWNKLLFQSGDYSGNPWSKHAGLLVDRRHFQRWLELFTEAVDNQFAGPKAEQAKNAARSIADTFQLRMGIPPEGVRLPPALRRPPVARRQDSQ